MDQNPSTTAHHRDGSDDFQRLLMETGVEHSKSRLHKAGYFRRLLATSAEIEDSIRPLLRLSRETIERCQKTEYALVTRFSVIRCWPTESGGS